VLLFAASLAACSTLHAEFPGLDQDLAAAVDGYLAAFLIEPVQGGQVYCATETLAVEQVGDAVKAWVWTLCEEFYAERGVLRVGSGFSGPLMVYLLANMEQHIPSAGEHAYMATGFAQPRDGSLWAGDIERIFPPGAIERMCLEDSDCSSARIERLEAELAVRTLADSGLPTATSTN